MVGCGFLSSDDHRANRQSIERGVNALEKLTRKKDFSVNLIKLNRGHCRCWKPAASRYGFAIGGYFQAIKQVHL